MSFWRTRLVILLLLVVGGGQLFAATRSERAYTAAVAAFHDGIYDRAETELGQFVDEYPNSSHVAEAVLLEGQAQFKQGKFTEAIATLSTPKGDWGKLADSYAYWLGEAQFGQGNFEHAAGTFTNLVATYPQSGLRLTAVVEAAAAYERLAEWQQLTALLGATNGIFAQMAALDSANEVVSRGRLLLAQAQFAQNDFAAARVTLNLLNPQTLAPDLDWQRANLLCRIELGAGALDAALAVSTNLLDIARLQKTDASTRLAESVALHATVLERMQRWQEAANAWSRNLTNASPADWQRQAILKMADIAVAEKDFTNAMSSLGGFLARFTNSPTTNLALLTLGELNLREYVVAPEQTNYLASALVIFDRLLTTNSGAADLAGKAYLDRGWCYWLAGDTNESLSDFQMATERLPLSEDLAVAKFKTGDALFALQDYSGARQSYESVLSRFATWPRVMDSLGDRALYQIVRCSVKLEDAAGAEQAMKQLLDRFPKSELRDNAELLLGEGLTEFASSTNAVSVFQDFIERFPDSPLRPQAELDVAQTLERSRDWSQAIASYTNWLDHFPTNALRPRVEYSLARAESQAGNDTNALARFVSFVAQYPTNQLAPVAQWWVADYYFRLGGMNVTNYSEAEKNYEFIFQNTNAVWKQSDLYYPAQLMAGRAAAGRQGYADAAKYYEDMANALALQMGDTNRSPELEALKTQALFAYGGVLMRWDSPDTNRPFLNFETATNVFTGLCQDNATSELGALAWSELGDCNLQLGAFDAATNAYWQVINSPYASTGLQSRAQVGLGRVLERMAELAPPAERKSLLNEALQNYLDVLYLKPEEADPFWTKKAGMLALPLMTTLKAGDPDKFIDRLEYWMPPLKETLEKKRAALKAEAQAAQ